MIECAKCGATASGVTDSRKTGQTMRRRRSCTACGARWTTYEVSAQAHEILTELDAFHARGMGNEDRHLCCPAWPNCDDAPNACIIANPQCDESDRPGHKG